MNAVWIVGGGVPDLQTIQVLSHCDTWVPMAAALFSPAQVGYEVSSCTNYSHSSDFIQLGPCFNKLMEVQVQGVFWRAQHLSLLISTASGGHLLSRRGRALLGERSALPQYRELLSFSASLSSFWVFPKVVCIVTHCCANGCVCN